MARGRRAKCRHITGHSFLSEPRKYQKYSEKKPQKPQTQKSVFSSLLLTACSLWQDGATESNLRPVAQQILGHHVLIQQQGKVWKWSVPSLQVAGTSNLHSVCKSDALMTLLQQLEQAKRQAAYEALVLLVRFGKSR